jgi:hypothetical protein
MKTLSISKAVRAGEALKAAARKADLNRDGALDRAELRAASQSVGKPLARALNEYGKQHRALTMRDPEESEATRRALAARMPVDSIDYTVRYGIEQLRRIDSYRGSRNPVRKANTPDGFVTDAEVKNYGRTGGRLQMDARPLAEFAASFKG